MSIWSKESYQDSIDEAALYEKVDNFFEQISNSKVLEYREGQHTMALDIVETIKSKEILLIEAGVGIGKSYGYLVPILYAYDTDPQFKGFIISTSTIALQEQLVKDIQNISKMLGIEIPVTIAKGKTNYVCKRRLEKLIENQKDKKQYLDILERISKGEIDRFDFTDLPEAIWKKINITSCSFQNCSKYLNCPYIASRKQFMQSSAIICNHDLLIQNLMRESDEKILQSPSLLVIDEAHNLEEKVRSSCEKYLDKRHIENIIYNIYHRILNFNDSVEIEQQFFDYLNGLFIEISKNAKRELKKNVEIDGGYEDCERVSFKVTLKIQQLIQQLLHYIQSLLKEVEDYEFHAADIIKSTGVKELKEIVCVLNDLLHAKDSKNNFWVEFLGNQGKFIRIVYVPKEINHVAARLLSDKSYGKVLTSATLTTKQDDYSYFHNSIGLDKIVGINVYASNSQKSPYDYSKNTLIYYGADIANPQDKEKYIENVSARILELFKITEGRSLVLFTSKKDMRQVYEKLCLGGGIIFQFICREIVRKMNLLNNLPI